MKYKTLPEHIAIIMDGNGRWAERQGLARTKGHAKGVEIIEGLVVHAFEKGIKYVTLFAFSTENWKRSKSEVSFLMKLLKKYIDSNLQRLTSKNIRLRVFGEKTNLSADLCRTIEDIENKSANCTKGTLCICFNYGGRAEIIKAASRFSGVEPTEENFRKLLYFSDIPDPEIVIRTGGEHRISNFLLYEMAYSEIFFLDKLWPDFTNDDLDQVIHDYMNIDRRFGGLK